MNLHKRYEYINSAIIKILTDLCQNYLIICERTCNLNLFALNFQSIAMYISLVCAYIH